jgi:peptide subunit release factor 1 (eRF1)
VVTDPTQRIRERETETPLDLHLDEALTRFAALPPSTEAPYLTITLDWRPDGQDPRRRHARQFIDQQLEEILGRYEYRSPEATSIRDAAERIRTFLDDELDPAAQGVVIVAGSEAGVFETLALGLPLENRVLVGPTPSLALLGRLAEDYAPFAVLLVDQHEATLAFIRQARQDRSVWLESTDYPRKQQAGGWSQRRFQARADERVSAFAQDIAGEVQKALDETGVDILILAGDEVMTSALDEHFHQSVKDRIAGTVRIDIRATEQDIVEATLPLVVEFERKQEAEAVRLLHENRGEGGLAAIGPEAVLAALQAGQVMTLIMADDFQSEGWADYSLPVYGVGKAPKRHPAGGDKAQMMPVQLEEEIVRLALQTGAEIEIIQSVVPMAELNGEDMEIPEAGSAPPRTEAAQSLDEVGGVGALLRFALSDEQSTATT